MAKPFVSIVVPHMGDDLLLNRCLEGIRKQTYPRELCEVLIVLNEPKRRFLECELQDGEIPLWEKRYFSYSARNRGIGISKGAIIAFTDSDTVPSPGWLEEGVTALKDSGADLAAGHITVTASSNTAPALYEQMFAFDQERNVRGGFSTTANLFAKRTVFRTHGPFEELAYTGGDFDWTKAATDGGATLVYARDAIVEHPARETWAALLAKARRTTLPFVDRSQGGSNFSARLQARLRFQLGSKPSTRKTNALTPPHRFIAHLVRIVLFAYKTLCLLRIPPAFQKDLQVMRIRLAARAPAIQEVFS